MAVTDDPAPDQWRIGVERTRAVPAQLKSFNQTDADAARTHGMTAACLDRLTDLGLDHHREGRERLFDDRDLANIALLLGLPTPLRRTMSSWSQTLLHKAEGTTTRRSVQLLAKCPEPGHAGACEYELNPAIGRCSVPGSLHERQAGRYTFQIETPNADHFLGPEHGEFVARMSAMEFHFIPPALTHDLDFATATGLADCRLGALLARQVATALGFEVRPRNGYFLAGPYMLWHNWIEILDGDWFAVDPFWLTTLARWQVPGIEAWPTVRSPQPLLWQPADEQDGRDFYYLLSHNGAPMRPAMMSAPCRS
ncbi:hypothetical protein AB0M46_22755 [Dactylosporangium sp. NPDC051485]|uniref:hypothetical protein n=1 Tax=Dactylosporangium sp. NPDC051485 TaxID=3154846 RepID=UPI0034123D70